MSNVINSFVPQFSVACAFVLAVVANGRSEDSRDNLVVRQFKEVDTLFANPGQGWMTQQRSPRGELRFPYSVVYIRFDWSAAEPEEGKFNWEIIDDAISAWAPHRATIGLRVMTCNAHSSGYYSSPKWLFDAGCKGHEYLRGGDDPTSGGKRIQRIEPDYADSVYLEKHAKFLKALGERYDGHPDIQFLDIGSYGIWGEWHTSHPAPLAVRKQIVDMYLAAFKKTSLVFMSDDAEVLNYALSKGTGMRRDGVGSPWHEQIWIGSKKYAAVEGMADTWKRAPVVFEWFGNYEYLQSRQWSFDAAVNFMLSNHVTLINDNVGKVPSDAMPRLNELTRRAGARFVLREIAHERNAAPGSTVNARMKWANAGVGRLNRPYVLSLSLLAANKKAAFTSIAEVDPRKWLPGEHAVSESFTVPKDLAPGDYTLALSIKDQAGRGRPFRLAMEAPEEDGLYEVSQITIAPELPARVDLRPDFERFKLTQRRQGKRGTCSVFVTVESIEFAVGRATGKAPRLSIEFANWAANAATRRSDDGDFFHNIIRGVEKFGICDEAAMPYQRTFIPTNAPSSNAIAMAEQFRDRTDLSFNWIRRWSKTAGVDDSDIGKMKSVLAKGYPVSAGSYHSILFVGYEDDPSLSGGGRFFVADSNLVETEITYEATKKRMSDLFWVQATPKSAATQ